MAKALHPDLMTDINYDEEAGEYFTKWFGVPYHEG
jgi:hypothetical protein